VAAAPDDAAVSGAAVLQLARLMDHGHNHEAR
jgi:hypothetical protein